MYSKYVSHLYIYIHTYPYIYLICSLGLCKQTFPFELLDKLFSRLVAIYIYTNIRARYTCFSFFFYIGYRGLLIKRFVYFIFYTILYKIYLIALFRVEIYNIDLNVRLSSSRRN